MVYNSLYFQCTTQQKVNFFSSFQICSQNFSFLTLKTFFFTAVPILIKFFIFFCFFFHLQYHKFTTTFDHKIISPSFTLPLFKFSTAHPSSPHKSSLMHLNRSINRTMTMEMQEKFGCQYNFICIECPCWKLEWKCEYFSAYLFFIS